MGRDLRDGKAQVPHGLETALLGFAPPWLTQVLSCIMEVCLCFSSNKCNEAIQIFELCSQEQQSLQLPLLFTYCVALGKLLKLSDACMELGKISCVKFRVHSEGSISVGYDSD